MSARRARHGAEQRGLAHRIRLAVVSIAWLGCWVGAVAKADEFPTLPDSSVLGQSYGIPSGAPSQGQPRVDTLEFVAETAVFFKNLELFGLKQTQGETFIGFLLPARLRYRSHSSVTIEAGAVIGHNFGDDDGLDVAEPLLRIIWEPIDGVFVVPGTLFPTHWIHDALLDDVQRLRQNAEQGLQLRVDRACWKNDAWINWRLREGAVRAEEFELGNSSELRFFSDHLYLEGQTLWSHAGGQRSSSDRLEHNLALMGGASLGTPAPLGWQTIDELRVGGRFFYSRDWGRNLPTRNGTAWEVWGRIDTQPSRWLTLRLFGGYFAGDDLVADRGDPLYAIDDYGQVGLTGVFEVARDLRLETGVVLQQTEGVTNYTYQVHFAWGQTFSLPVSTR